MSTTVLIAIGSNRRHRFGPPKAVIEAAIAALEAAGLAVDARSRVRTTLPLGPGGRAYANAVVAVSVPHRRSKTPDPLIPSSCRGTQDPSAGVPRQELGISGLGDGLTTASFGVQQLLPGLLLLLQSIEQRFGRRRGQRWGARTLDLDILAAGTAVYPSKHRWLAQACGLLVPHLALAHRSFVLDPLVEIAPDWRHPVLHLSARQLRARHARPKASRELGP